MNGFFITGTDTDVGKTIASAWACLHLDGCYWKPVQAGLSDGMSDKDDVARLTEFDQSRFFDSQYNLTQPLSPHEAASRDSVRIELDEFSLPSADRPLIVEGAGGVMVPLNDKSLMIDLMGHLALPVIIVARSSLGTINHTLLTIAALRRAKLPIAGIIINGEINQSNNQAIAEFGHLPILGILPRFPLLNKTALLETQPLIHASKWTPSDD